MLNAEMLQKATVPVILCSFSNRTAKLVEAGQYVPLNLNVELAEALLEIPPTQRARNANDAVMKIISLYQSPTIFENYEILFDPRYDIDALKVFAELARRQKVVVKWCGGIKGNTLEYAVPEYPDYHAFKIQDYDIICVV